MRRTRRTVPNHRIGQPRRRGLEPIDLHLREGVLGLVLDVGQMGGHSRQRHPLSGHDEVHQRPCLVGRQPLSVGSGLDFDVQENVASGGSHRTNVRFGSGHHMATERRDFACIVGECRAHDIYRNPKVGNNSNFIELVDAQHVRAERREHVTAQPYTVSVCVRFHHRSDAYFSDAGQCSVVVRERRARNLEPGVGRH